MAICYSWNLYRRPSILVQMFSFSGCSHLSPPSHHRHDAYVFIFRLRPPVNFIIAYSLFCFCFQVSVPIVSNDRCKSMFLRAGRHEFIPDIFLCAGHETGGQDSCQGDSGGPLQVRCWLVFFRGDGLSVGLLECFERLKMIAENIAGWLGDPAVLNIKGLVQLNLPHRMDYYRLCTHYYIHDHFPISWQ